MSTRKTRILATAAVLPLAGGIILAAAGAASASTTFVGNSPTFAGKGDVQNVFGLNNNQLQTDAPNISFTLHTNETKLTSVSWTCTNAKNEVVQPHADTTTTTDKTTGEVVTAPRVKAQITGFNLSAGSSTIDSQSSVDGDPLNQCPANPHGDTWYLSQPAGNPVTVSDTTDQYLSVVDGDKVPVTLALDGANVWHLTNGTNQVSGSLNFGLANGSVY